jgi:predicted permease
MALSLVLLIGAGLMIRSFLRLQRVETGFATEGRVLFDIELPPSTYGERDAFAGFVERFVEGIEALPPVDAVGAVSVAPMAQRNTNMPILAEGQVLGEGQRTPITEWRFASPGYFRAMGLTLLGGRVWDDMSNEEYRAGVVISQNLAQQLWGDDEPVGKRAFLRGNPALATHVIGVVSDQVDRGLERGSMNMVFYSYGWGLRSPVTFIVHAAAAPATVLAGIRGVLREIDPKLPVSNARTLDEIVSSNTARRSLLTFIFLAFAFVALVLACTGLYGVMAYSVSRRTPEIAVRMALGGLPSGVVRLIVGQGMRWAMVGAGAGIVASVALTRFMEAMLFEVTAFDPTAWYTVTLVLLGTALLSCLVPALRIARLDPVVALREE